MRFSQSPEIFCGSSEVGSPPLWILRVAACAETLNIVLTKAAAINFLVICAICFPTFLEFLSLFYKGVFDPQVTCTCRSMREVIESDVAFKPKRVRLA